MKISTYTPVASASITLPSGHATASANINAYGGKTDTSALDNLMKFATKIQEDRDKRHVLEGMDKYQQGLNDLLYNEKNGYMHNKMDAADGNTEDFAAKEEALRKQILGDSHIVFGANRAGFEHSMRQASRSSFEKVRANEYAQMEAKNDFHFGNILNGAILEAQEGGADAITSARDKITIGADLAYGGKGVDVLASKTQGALQKFATAVMQDKLAKNDFVGASDFYTEYKDYMTPEQRTNFNKVSTSKQTSMTFDNTVKNLFAKHGNNIEAIFKEIDGMSEYETVIGGEGYSVPRQEEGTTWTRKQGVSFEGLSTKARSGLDLAAKIYSDMFGEKLLVTSGMDGTHTTHKGNDLDITDDWESTVFSKKENRDKFIEALKPYNIRVFNEYENDSKYKTGDHLHLEFVNYNPEGTHTVKHTITPEERRQLKSLAQQKLNENNLIKRNHADNLYDDIQAKAYEIKKNGGTLSEAKQQLLDSAYYDAKDNETAEKALAHVFNTTVNKLDGSSGSGGSSGGSGYGKGAHAMTVYSIKQMLDNNDPDVTDKATLMQRCARLNLSESDTAKIAVAYDQWKNREGEYKYKWKDIKQRVLAEAPKYARASKAGEEQFLAEGRAAATEFIYDYVRDPKNHGMMPSDAQIVAAYVKGGTPRTLFEYKDPDSWRSQEMNIAPGAIPGATLRVHGDMVDIMYTDGRTSYSISKDEFRKRYGKQGE